MSLYKNFTLNIFKGKKNYVLNIFCILQIQVYAQSSRSCLCCGLLPGVMDKAGPDLYEITLPEVSLFSHCPLGANTVCYLIEKRNGR